MNLRRRPMKLTDIDQCIAAIAIHRESDSIYDGHLEPLKNILVQLVGSEGFLAFVFEDLDGQQVQLLGIGAIAFLNDEFVEQAKKPPFFWIAPTLVQQLLSGHIPILSDVEVRKENALGGLTAFAWPLGFRTEHLSRPEVLNFLMGSFMNELQGYRLKEYLGQTLDVEGARTSLHSGATLLTPTGLYTALPAGREEQVLLNPHLFVITRERALEKVGAWSSSLFIYSPPLIYFSRSEQRLLSQALRGLTDEEVADELGISPSGVKKTWRSAYLRVERSSIDILPKTTDQTEYGDRGRGKKHHLLAYVREHLEELRPISAKLLRKVQKDARNGLKKNGPSTSRRRVGRPRSARP